MPYPRKYWSVRDTITNTILQHGPPVLSWAVSRRVAYSRSDTKRSNHLQKTNLHKEARERIFVRQPDFPYDRIRKVRKDLWCHMVQNHAQSRGHLKLDLTIKVDQVAPSQIQSSFEHPKDVNSPNFQSSLFQSLTTLTVIFFFLLSNWNFTCCSLCPFPPVLLLCTSKKNVSIFSR